MNTPHRIQRKRTKGWKMPPNTVYVGRPTRWGNPYIPDDYNERGRRECVDEYRKHWWRDRGVWKFDIGGLNIAELHGKNLACWCPLGQPCHADVLLEIANQGEL